MKKYEDIDEVEEEIKSIKSKGRKIYRMCDDIIEEFGSPYSDIGWVGYIKFIFWFIFGTTKERSLFECDGIKITSDLHNRNIYYNDELVFSGYEKYKKFGRNKIILEKVILCDWVEKIEEVYDEAKEIQKKRKMKEKKKDLEMKKKKYKKRCEVEM